jgi:ribosomal-protein-alanine N-acetyltransferase
LRALRLCESLLIILYEIGADVGDFGCTMLAMEHGKGASAEQSIATTRLLIRPFNENDSQDLYEYLSNPTVYRFEPGEPVTLAQAAQLAHERAITTDFWAIELKSTGKMIGHLYLGQIEPAEMRTWELGYILNPAFQRQGVATEASLGLLRAAFKTNRIHRVIAHCNPDNPASWRVLEKVGLRREGLLRKNVYFRKGPAGEELWTDTYEYAMLDEEADEKLGAIPPV